MSEPQPVQPAPVPLTVMTGIAEGPAGRLVVIQVLGPTGAAVYFFDPAAAEGIAEGIIATARQARSRLVVPTLHLDARPSNGHPGG